VRRSDWVLCTFFLYIAALSTWRNQGVSVPSAIAGVIPVALVAIARADSRSQRRGWSIARDWIPAALVLVAYWSVDWVPTKPHNRELESAFILWDRTLLLDWGLKAAAEQVGSLVPGVLELAYLVLYAVPPLCIVSFYLNKERDRLDGFLFPFLVGTLTVYALLPHFPVEGPRFAFPNENLPQVMTVFRRLNLWLLDHCDIRASVFPSGHVAAAFSAAFAMRLAAPRRQAFAGALLALAVLVWLNTIYSRYHYAADGLAAVAMTTATMGIFSTYRRRQARMTSPANVTTLGADTSATSTATQSNPKKNPFGMISF
jgi:membrane-associated phospholipid phosphatase